MQDTTHKKKRHFASVASEVIFQLFGLLIFHIAVAPFGEGTCCV